MVVDFPAPFRPDEPEQLAFVEGEVDALEGVDRSVASREQAGKPAERARSPFGNAERFR